MWKGPRLTCDIADLTDINASLFLDLAAHGVLNIIAWLNKSGQSGIELLRKAMLMTQQAAVARVTNIITAGSMRG